MITVKFSPIEFGVLRSLLEGAKEDLDAITGNNLIKNACKSGIDSILDALDDGLQASSKQEK